MSTRMMLTLKNLQEVLKNSMVHNLKPYASRQAWSLLEEVALNSDMKISSRVFHKFKPRRKLH